MDGKIRIVMEVTEERDGEAFQPGGPTPERDFFANDPGTVGLDQCGVGGKGRHASGGCEADKLSSGDGRKGNRFSGACATGLTQDTSRIFQHNPNSADSLGCREHDAMNQKLNVPAVLYGGWPRSQERTDLLEEHWEH